MAAPRRFKLIVVERRTAHEEMVRHRCRGSRGCCSEGSYGCASSQRLRSAKRPAATRHQSGAGLFYVGIDSLSKKHCDTGAGALGFLFFYFFAPMTLAHLARCAALILANPAAEMRRLGAIETTLWPRARAQRAFCEAEILARAAALIFRGPRTAPVVFNPVSALIAVSNAFTCCAALSRSAFNCAIMSMC